MNSSYIKRGSRSKVDAGRLDRLVEQNIAQAGQRWGTPSEAGARQLRELTERHGLSVAAGDLQLLEGRWYVTHAGLINVARRNRCSGIEAEPVQAFCEPAASRWVFKATVYPTPRSRGFVGYGDADPGNVSPLVRGSEMRISETRAVNRALRKAYGVGLCSVEEIGSSPRPEGGANGSKPASRNGDGEIHQQPLRDRLWHLIRKYQLDAAAVKQYAVEFCEVPRLREAPKEKVEAFIETLAERAASDRAALVCQLTSYPTNREVPS